MKNVLITGGCGFIGSNFVNYIADRYPECVIVNYDKLILNSDAYNVSKSVRKSANYHLVTGDIKNKHLLAETLTKYEIDTIVHFAADCTSVYCYNDPVEACQRNIDSFVIMLEVCRQHERLQRFVHISTDEVYGDSPMGESAVPMTETLMPKPSNPYAATKVAGEAMCHSYVKSYKMPIVIARMNNVYGPNQWNIKVLPRFIKLAYERQPFTFQGSGDQLRSWLYARDAAEGVCAVMQKGTIGEIYNIGTDFELSVRDLSIAVEREVNCQLGREAPKQEAVPIADRPYNDQRYLIDTRKVTEELGSFQLIVEAQTLEKNCWKATTPFAEGLRLTVQSELEKLQNPTRPHYQEVFVVYGGNGWIGSQIIAVLNEQSKNYHIAQAKIGRNTDAEVLAELNTLQATHIICATGRTHGAAFNTIDYLDQGGADVCRENIADNLYCVVRLAQMARDIGAHLTYIGTAFMHDSYHNTTQPTIIDDDAVPNFSGNSYSVAKGFAERLLAPYLPHTVLNLRITLPINFDMTAKRNLLAKILIYPKLLDVQGSFSILPDCLPAAISMACRRITGNVNLVNPGTISLHEIMTLYREIVDCNVHQWVTITSEDAKKMLAKKPVTILCTKRLLTYCPDIPTISESLRSHFEKMGE